MIDLKMWDRKFQSRFLTMSGLGGYAMSKSQNKLTMPSKVLFDSKVLAESVEDVDATLYNLIRDKKLFDECLKESSAETFYKLGQDLLRGFENARAPKADYQALLLTFLDLARANVLLKRIYQENRADEWFKLILSIIKAANFTTGQLFLQRTQRYRNQVLFKVLKGKRETNFTWLETAQKVQAIAKGLFALVSKNDELCQVAILSENNLEVACVDLACLTSGFVNVPIPANSVDTQVAYILKKSGAKIVFVSDDSQLAKVLSHKKELPNLQYIVKLKPKSRQQKHDVNVLGFEEFLSKESSISTEIIKKAAELVKVDDLATVMYTSGTTETPKGIIFSQLNLVCKRFARAMALPEIGEQDVFLCYLPLFHTFGRFFEMMGAIFWGGTYVFAESPKIDTLVENFKLVKPTVFISIPRKWIQLYESVQEKTGENSQESGKIKEELAKVTGGRLKWGLSAAGYLDPDIFCFFQQNGIELMSGFGMTEATGGITMTPPFQYKTNSVGKALPGIDIKLAEDGEMLIRGPYVMQGYVHAADASFNDGWLNTGDIFSKDDEGFYRILDRKKDIYKNIRGETIAPQKIENLFLDFESVKQVFLVGDHRPYNTLLLYPNYEYSQLDLASMTQSELRDFFTAHVVWVNRFLAPFERIVDFAIIDRQFDKTKGEVTQKGTFRRKTVEDSFRHVIEEMYRTDYAKLKVSGFEIRLPNWFLRENGLTSADVKLEKNCLVLTPIKSKLAVEISNKAAGKIRLGCYWYSTQEQVIDLDQIITSPNLWLGNIEIAEFVGEGIFNWSKKNRDNTDIKVVGVKTPRKPTTSTVRKFTRAVKEKRNTLPGLHYATFMLQTRNDELAANGLDYVKSLVEGSSGGPSKHALSVLNLVARSDNIAIKSEAFRILVEHTRGAELTEVLENYLRPYCDFLDDVAIAKVSEQDLSNEQLESVFTICREYQSLPSE